MSPPRRSYRRSSLSAGAIVLILALAFLAYLIHQGENPGAGTPLPPLTPEPATSQGWYRLYFTDPTAATATDHRGGPDEALAEAIDRAQTSVDIAAYSLNLPSLQEALLDAQDRGVRVRIVMESDNLDGDVPQALKKAGLPILGDRREKLMHNKFVIIDREEVWTGSMNFTTNGAYDDNNNLIAIASTDLAEDYSSEFEEMFTDDAFGPGSPANTPHPTLSMGGALLEVYFSPEDGAGAHIAQWLASARESILFLAYSFTSDPLAEIIRERGREGVSVRGVMEAGQVSSNKGGEYPSFREAGLDVRLDGNPGQMHHKVIVVDGETVVLGSYNFSASAEDSNDENVLIIQDASLAAQFKAEFEKVYSQGQE